MRRPFCVAEKSVFYSGYRVSIIFPAKHFISNTICLCKEGAAMTSEEYCIESREAPYNILHALPGAVYAFNRAEITISRYLSIRNL